MTRKLNSISELAIGDVVEYAFSRDAERGDPTNRGVVVYIEPTGEFFEVVCCDGLPGFSWGDELFYTDITAIEILIEADEMASIYGKPHESDLKLCGQEDGNTTLMSAAADRVMKRAMKELSSRGF